MHYEDDDGEDISQPIRYPLLEIPSGGCHWPLGHPNEPHFRFCGAPAMAGRPYCARHAAIAYVGRERAAEIAERNREVAIELQKIEAAAADKPLAARDVTPGESWAFKDHPTMAAVEGAAA